MISLRPAQERGHANHGWLNSFHSFSFANYFDPRYMGVSSLRVINDDMVAPGAGFGTHGHRDMEIISYVLAGALQHNDSMGNGSIIRPGEIQRMSAGTGIRHSEYNVSPSDPVHFLQIWIVPNVTGIAPSYEQLRIDYRRDGNPFTLIASPEIVAGAVTIHQDARLYVAKLDAGEAVTQSLLPQRLYYLHVADGSLKINGTELRAGDGATIESESMLTITANLASEVLLFDLRQD